MLQESCTDSTGSLVVYATMEVDYIQLVMSGEDPSCIPLLPMGFSITPLGPTDSESSTSGSEPGCLLTVGLQVHTSTIPSAKLNLSSVSTINNHICNVVHQINATLGTPASTSIIGSGNASTANNPNHNDGNACIATTNGSSSALGSGSGSYPEPNSSAAATSK